MTYRVNGITVIDLNKNVTVAGANVIGAGSVGAAIPSVTTNGYVAGGNNVSPGLTLSYIEKFSFANDVGGTATVGELTQGRQWAAGQSSSTHGHISGGLVNVLGGPLPAVNTVDRFTFVYNENARDIGDLTIARSLVAGQSSSTHGYTTGGGRYANIPSSLAFNKIDKFPFATTFTVATNVGTLTSNVWGAVGQSSSTHGYTSGGYALLPAAGTSLVISKFPFASDTNATNVGNLTQARHSGTGQSSSTHGYVSGGEVPGTGGVNVIDRFPFASDTNATDVGDLAGGGVGGAGISSPTSGYVTSLSPGGSKIYKFPFAATTTNAGVSSFLTFDRSAATGVQG